MKITIETMSAGYNVLVERPMPRAQLPLDSPARAIQDVIDKQNAVAQYGEKESPPTRPFAAAFSTFAEVGKYVRDQLGIDSDTDAAPAVNSMASPGVDYMAENRREHALWLAVQSYPASRFETVVNAAQTYESYLRGEGGHVPSTDAITTADKL